MPDLKLVDIKDLLISVIICFKLWSKW